MTEKGLIFDCRFLQSPENRREHLVRDLLSGDSSLAQLLFPVSKTFTKVNKNGPTQLFQKEVSHQVRIILIAQPEIEAISRPLAVVRQRSLRKERDFLPSNVRVGSGVEFDEKNPTNTAVLFGRVLETLLVSVMTKG